MIRTQVVGLEGCESNSHGSCSDSVRPKLSAKPVSLGLVCSPYAQRKDAIVRRGVFYSGVVLNRPNKCGIGDRLTLKDANLRWVGEWVNG